MARAQHPQLVYAALSLAVSVGVLSYLYAQVSLAAVWRMITSSYVPALCGFVALAMTLQVLRTIRYGLVLNRLGWSARPVPLFLVVLVRGLFVDLLPARLGELVFIYLVRSRLRIPIGPAVASFALAFLFDLLVLAPLLLLAALWLIVMTGAAPPVLALAAVAVGAAALAALRLLPGLVRFAFGVLGRVPVAPRCTATLRRLAAAIHRSLTRAAAARLTAPLFGLSILVRVTKYAALYVLLFALVRRHGYSLADLPVPEVFVGLCSAEMAASLPVSGIGGFGAYEGAWAVVFGLLVFPASLAQVTSLAHHLITQVYGYGLGVLAMLALVGTGRPRR